MARPTVIIAEPEPLDALSTRKLVLETAKFNVLTAHDNDEAVEILQEFPKIGAIVLAEGRGIDCGKLARKMKDKDGEIPIVALSPRIGAKCAYADHNLSSHEPEKLLGLIRSLLGDPRNQKHRKAS